VAFYPKEPIFIELKLPNGSIEHYISQLPFVSIHNLIFGKIYIDLMGTTVCTNLNTGEKSEILWKEKGWSNANYTMVEGVTKNLEGKPVYLIKGKYCESLRIQKHGESDDKAIEVWAIRPKPP
jgi:hypothetical protein